MKLCNNLASRKSGMTIFFFGLLLMLSGCVSGGDLLIIRMQNPDVLSLTRMQPPSAVKTYIFTKDGEGYWVDVSVNDGN